jgi:hypothetical protein
MPRKELVQLYIEDESGGRAVAPALDHPRVGR